MRICVIGAGLLGLTSAYFLSEYGHDVVVVDRQSGPGLETSFANGGLLTPSMSDPWNAPGSWRVLLGSLLHSDSPLQLRFSALPSLGGWGLEFMRNAKAERYRRATLLNLALARYSLGTLRSLRQHAALDYDAGDLGSLRIFRDQETLHAQAAVARALEPHGIQHRVLSREALTSREAALAPIAAALVGAIHYPGDETGDAHRFCVALTEHLRARGVAFQFSDAVLAIERNGGRIAAVRTQSGRAEADAFVVAAGSWTPRLLAGVGVLVPVRPAKGYSVTLPRPAHLKLKHPIIDDALHAALTPLGNVIRIAGTAEFAGYDLRSRPERIRNLEGLAKRLVPEAHFDMSAAKPWCGLRPMSSDGLPIIGATRIANLWLNTGHGHLGWTMAAGSGRLLAQLVSGEATDLDCRPYALARFKK
jgi:D-amino-acid dehydrogenase